MEHIKISILLKCSVIEKSWMGRSIFLHTNQIIPVPWKIIDMAVEKRTPFMPYLGAKM
jgi:hypothetical protein